MNERMSQSKEKSFRFAIRCVRLYLYLRDNKREYDISRQLLRSGTSIGANIREGLFAQSKPDFLAKFSIAKKEASETEYWLELLKETDILTPEQADSMLNDCRELIRILVSSCKTMGNKR